MESFLRHIVKYIGDHPYAGKYVGAGGAPQDDMQKAQVFGWAKRAVEKLDGYRGWPKRFQVIPVRIVPEENATS